MKRLIGAMMAAVATACVAEPGVTEMLERAKNGPSLLFTKAMLPGIVAHASTNPAAAKILKGLVKRVDGKISAEGRTGAVAVPDRGGQWTLWMTCKKCGSPLKSQTPTRHVC